MSLYCCWTLVLCCYHDRAHWAWCHPASPITWVGVCCLAEGEKKGGWMMDGWRDGDKWGWGSIKRRRRRKTVERRKRSGWRVEEGEIQLERERKTHQGSLAVFSPLSLSLSRPGSRANMLHARVCPRAWIWSHGDMRGHVSLSVYCLWEEITVCRLAVLHHRSLATADMKRSTANCAVFGQVL